MVSLQIPQCLLCTAERWGLDFWRWGLKPLEICSSAAFWGETCSSGGKRIDLGALPCLLGDMWHWGTREGLFNPSLLPPGRTVVRKTLCNPPARVLCRVSRNPSSRPPWGCVAGAVPHRPQPFGWWPLPSSPRGRCLRPYLPALLGKLSFFMPFLFVLSF